MSISAVSSSSSYFPGLSGSATWQSRNQQMQTEFQQLGQDLQSGNVSQAKQDFSTLTQNFPMLLQQASANGTQAGSGSPVSQAMSSLQQDLQSGNVTAAQSDLTTLQQNLQQAGAAHGFRRHHPGGGPQGGQNSSVNQNSVLNQDLSSLQQALQSGNLSAAQTAYASVQQDMPQFGAGSTFSIAA